MDPEFIAGVTGALVGGAISYVLQRQVFAKEAAQRAADRKQAVAQSDEVIRQSELNRAFSIMLKVTAALNGLQQASGQLHRAVLTSVRERMDLAGAMRAFSADFDRIKFDTDELILIRSLRNADLFNELLNLPAVLDLYIDNFAVVRRLRMEMQDLVEQATLTRTGAGTSAFSGASAAKAKIKSYEVKSLALHMYARVFHDLPNYNNVACDLQDALINRFGKKDLSTVWGLERVSTVPRRTPG